MSQPVYLLVIGKGWTEAWYQLSEEEKDNLWSKVSTLTNGLVESSLSGAILVGRTKKSSIGLSWNIPIWMPIKRKSKNLKNWAGGDTSQPKQFWEQKWKIPDFLQLTSDEAVLVRGQRLAIQFFSMKTSPGSKRIARRKVP